METNAFNFSLESLFLPKEAENASDQLQTDLNALNTSLDFPELVELIPASDTTQNNAAPFLFENPTSGNFNFFGEYNNLFANNSAEPTWKLFSSEQPAQILATSIAPEELKMKSEKEETLIAEDSKKETLVNLVSSVKTENNSEEEEVEEQEAPEPSSPARKRQKQTKTTKKSKKNLSPEELEEKKRIQLEKRLIKNRRTADISRKRKKAKKATLEESIKKLSEDNVVLEKQSIELSAENRVLKSEYLALLSLIQNTPKLSKMFDNISNLAVSQPPEKLVMANTASAASVYLLNIIYSIHQTWNLLKNVNNGSVNNPSLPNIAVN